MGDVAVAHKRRELILSVLFFVMLPLKKRFGKAPSYVQPGYGVQLDGKRKTLFGLKPQFAAYEACILRSRACLRQVLYDQIRQIEVPNTSPKFCVLSVLLATRFVNQYNTSYIIFCVVL